MVFVTRVEFDIPMNSRSNHECLIFYQPPLSDALQNSINQFILIKNFKIIDTKKAFSKNLIILFNKYTFELKLTLWGFFVCCSNNFFIKCSELYKSETLTPTEIIILSHAFKR